MMDKTITTHTLQSRLDKKSDRGMLGKKSPLLILNRRLTILFLIIPKPHSLILSLGF